MKTITLRDGTAKTVNPGQIMVCDIIGRPIRIQPGLTSFLSPAFRLGSDGQWQRIN